MLNHHSQVLGSVVTELLLIEVQILKYTTIDKLDIVIAFTKFIC